MKIQDEECCIRYLVVVEESPGRDWSSEYVKAFMSEEAALAYYESKVGQGSNVFFSKVEKVYTVS
jgi:hypothetical protein